MAGSVWYPQINKALKELIPSIVKAYSPTKELIPVEVVVRNPETEYKIEKFPCVSIFSYDERFDIGRYLDVDKVIVERDIERGKALVEAPAKPYNLFYQIDFWAKYQSDIDIMTMTWANTFTKHNVLKVKDTLNNLRECYMRQLGYAVADEVREKRERIFHRVYSYEIWVELDETQPVEVPIVLTPEITNKGVVK